MLIPLTKKKAPIKLISYSNTSKGTQFKAIIKITATGTYRYYLGKEYWYKKQISIKFSRQKALREPRYRQKILTLTLIMIT